VVQQVQQRDLVAVSGRFWNVFVNASFTESFPLLLEKQDARGGEFFEVEPMSNNSFGVIATPSSMFARP